MPEQHQHRREDDADFVSHVRAADSGLQIVRRGVETIVLLIGFGVSIGLQVAQNRDFTTVANEFRAYRESTEKKEHDRDIEDANAKRDKQEMEKRVAELEEFRSRQLQAYNFVLSQGIAEVRGRLNMKPLNLPQQAEKKGE